MPLTNNLRDTIPRQNHPLQILIYIYSFSIYSSPREPECNITHTKLFSF